HGAAEQPPLHSSLDHQGQVRLCQHLDHRDRRADVPGAAVLLTEPLVGDAGGGDDLHLLEYLGAGDDRVRRVMPAELFMAELGPRLVLHVTPTPVQRVAQMLSSACVLWRHNPTVTSRARGGNSPSVRGTSRRRADAKAPDTPSFCVCSRKLNAM